MKHTIIAFSILAALLVASPSFAGNKKTSQDAQQRANAQAMVDASLENSLQSIDKSLDVLVGLSRGGEPPRAAPAAYGNTGPNPVASTVAGGARQVTVDERVRLSVPVNPPPTSAEMSSAQAPMMHDTDLDRLVDISWDGSVHQLLSTLSKQLGFHFSQGVSKRYGCDEVCSSDSYNVAPLNSRVKVHVKGATVRHVLYQVASQVEGRAEIHVSVPRKSISLIRK